MKAIVCELCGGNKLVKEDDGYFVCQHCGTKYAPEQAKKLLVEIEVSGELKVNNLPELNDLITRARTLKTQGKIDAAIERCESALDLDPDNEEACELLEELERTIDEPNLTIRNLTPSAQNFFVGKDFVFQLESGQDGHIALTWGPHKVGWGILMARTQVPISIKSRKDKFLLVLTKPGMFIEHEVSRLK